MCYAQMTESLPVFICVDSEFKRRPIKPRNGPNLQPTLSQCGFTTPHKRVCLCFSVLVYVPLYVLLISTNRRTRRRISMSPSLYD